MFVREFQLKHLASFHLTFFITQLAVGQIPQGANRRINNAVNDVFALKSITYPTGGMTEFTYALNATNYVDQSAVVQVGFNPPNAVKKEYLKQGVYG